MTPGQIVDFIVTTLCLALVAIIGFLLRDRVAEILARLTSLESTVTDNSREIVRLTEAQKAVVTNQGAQSIVTQRVLDEADDLAEKTADLERLTGRLYDRLTAHDEFLEALRQDRRIVG